MIKELEPRAGLRTPWNFSTSVFKGYKPDTEKLMFKCFEADWKMIAPNIEVIVKDPAERSRVKELCSEHYKYIRHAYKYSAGVDIINNFPAVGAGEFTHLMQACGDYIDMRIMKTTDIDIAKATVKGKDGIKAKHNNIP